MARIGPARTGIEAAPGAASEVAPEVARRPLSAAAQRALAEAQARREAAEASGRAEEFGGRDGPDPTRYGDWEKDGLAKDF